MKKSLVVLAFGTLGLGIAEFGMMSILSAAAEGLGISIAKAGHLISAYALGVCFGAVALVFLSRGKPLKTLLIALMAVMCAGNLLAVFAPNYELMMMARFISGLPHGGYFGVAGIAAKKLAARGKEVEAVSVMISGMTVANLLGIPMASYLTHIMSWHMLFAVVAAWGCLRFMPFGNGYPILHRCRRRTFGRSLRFCKSRSRGFCWRRLCSATAGCSAGTAILTRLWWKRPDFRFIIWREL